MENVRIFVTGGHLTPALAVIDEIRTRHPGWEIHFLGRRTVFENSGTESEEERLVTARGIPFVPIETGRLRRSIDWLTFRSLARVPRGMWQAYGFCRQYRPDIVVSFGGYVAFPVVVAAAVLRIRILTHEQAPVPGMANRWIARLADVVCVSTSEAATHFPRDKVVVTGLPIRKSVFNPPQAPGFRIIPGRPVLYVQGGATGSEFVNAKIRELLPVLLKKYTVIHQVGRQWIGAARRWREAIRGDLRRHYLVAGYYDEPDHAWILHHAAAVIGRSGANSVAELRTLGVPAVLIPIPNSSGNEQYENARRLADSGTAMVLDQRTMTPADLASAIERMAGQHGLRPPMTDRMHRSPAAAVVAQIERLV